MKKLLLKAGCCLVITAVFVLPQAAADEVITQTPTKVVVREHIKTGKPYVVITSAQGDRNPFASIPVATRVRPDYRLLDPKVKASQVRYEGPVSDRKKVYIFAGTIAALGTAGGAAVIAAAPAATGAGAAGGAGGYAAAGTAVAAGTISTSVLNTRPDPEKDKIEQGFSSAQISDTVKEGS